MLPVYRGYPLEWLLFNKGVLEKVLDPGPYWITISKSISVIDIRLQTLNVAGQDILTAEGFSLKISLAGEYQIDNPRALPAHQHQRHLLSVHVRPANPP